MHSPAQEEALASETASLGLNPETRFYPIRTSWIALLQLILFVSILLFSCCENILLIGIKSYLNYTSGNELGKINFLKKLLVHLRTIFVSSLSFQIGYETLQFILPNKTLMDGKSLSIGSGETDPPFSFLVLLHVGLWVVIFISDRTLQYLHHQSQARGYLEFFRETKELRRFPHYVLSTGMTLSQKLSFLHVYLLIINLKSLTIVVTEWLEFSAGFGPVT